MSNIITRVFRKLLITAGCCFYLSTHAQHSELTISGDFQGVSLEHAIQELENKYPVRFFFKPHWIQDQEVNVQLRNVTVSQAARLLLSQTSLHYVVRNQRMVIITPQNIQESTPEVEAVTYEISGYLRDGNTLQPINPGTLYFSGSTEHTINTNSQGYFKLRLPYGRYAVKALGQGAFERNFEFDVFKDTFLELELLERTIELEDVIISSTGLDNNISGTNSGRVTVNIETLSSMPAFLGEIDISRAVLTIPGVSTVGEGARGFNVRGGNLDQNLILMDNIPLYNSSHLLGFFSVFNPDMIQSFTLHKGGIPARYGGKISSVLEVRQQVSNKEQLQLKASAGFVTSKLFADIPLIKGKAGLILAGRGAYPGWVINKIDDQTLRKSDASYWDLNAKFDIAFNEENLLELTGYGSSDSFSFAEDTVFKYQTRALSLNYQHVFSNNNSFLISGSYSNYQAFLDNNLAGQESRVQNGIQQIRTSTLFSFNNLLGHELEAGFDLSYYSINAGERKSLNNSAASFEVLPTESGLETALFISDNISVTPNLKLMLGLRYSQFHLVGTGTHPIFDPSQPRSASTIVDILSLDKGEFEKISSGLEPRVAVNFTINPTTALKAGYNRTRQYIHLLSNTVAALPTDPWKLSAPGLRPLVGDQLTLGLFKNFKDNTFETSLEGFYKEIADIIDFRDGTQVLLNKQIVSTLLQGQARAKGIELSMAKQKGLLKGRLGYTYSKSEILFNSTFPQEQLNKGVFFAANFDRPHQLSLDSEYKLSRLWTVSSSFTLNSGRPVTLPGSSYTVGNVRVFSDIERNNYRIPDYHRLDLAVTLKGSNKRNKKVEHSWTFSIYNVYARKNPFSVYLNAPNGVSPRVFQLSVLGTAFPSLTYNLHLK